MNILKNSSLYKLNSFGVKHKSKYLIEIKRKEDISFIINNKDLINEKIIIVGGGSNILFTKDFDGIVLLNKILGINKLDEDKNFIKIRVGSGENWDKFVSYCVDNNYYGIENLSLIPGSVGAAPIQNIGAYGVEIKDFIDNVQGYDLEEKEEKIYSRELCCFKYRNSIFKKEKKNKFFITHVEFILNKKPNYILTYKDLNNLNRDKISLKYLRDKVIEIRNSKLPNTEKLGNAGSFFKNPIIKLSLFDSIKLEYDDISGHKIGENNIKLSAAWLIEKCGWKGKVLDKIGVYKKHALVLVNYGEESGNKIKKLSEEISKSVEKKFGIILEEEVNII
tara:strand:+ start:9266 stop:10270 length:1005 start_codon:yes stop_codon:yes gene_type:complete